MHVKFPPGYNHCSSASDAPTHPCHLKQHLGCGSFQYSQLSSDTPQCCCQLRAAQSQTNTVHYSANKQRWLLTALRYY